MPPACRPHGDVQPHLLETIEMTQTTPSQLLRDIAYERIKEAIRMAELQPGQPLSETALSKMLGISRTPVREALQALAQKGLVQIIPGRAVTVAAPSISEVMDAIHIRSLLEPEVARLATRTITPEQLERMWEAMKGLEEAVEVDDRQAWARADAIFHETLSAACPNQLLGELALQIRNRISYLAIDVQDNVARLKACTAEHRVILERIAEGDSEGACEAMREHINLYRESIFRRLSHR
ncbi:MAG: GntR family transcriptional regulator [Caldilineae bacterium]|nr:MAG: GntR family transcriptional regulator [Caldilineae bacterium]